MGLSATLQDAVVTIMGAIGDIAVDVTYHRVTTGSYNASTDTQTVTTSETTLKGFFYKAKEDTDDYQRVTAKDRRLLLAGSTLGFVPSEKDYLYISSVKYEITQVKILPGGAGYILFIRSP